MIHFDTFKKLPKNVRGLGKIIVAKGFKNFSSSITSESEKISDQSYKQFMLVIYDSRVVRWGIFKSATTLES